MNTYNTQTQLLSLGNNNVFQGRINVENLFESAITLANEGWKTKAIEVAREALIFAKQINSYTMVYIHSFLASMSLDSKNITTARIHCYAALNRLDSTHYEYKTDKKYLEMLLQIVEKADKTPQQLYIDTVAA